MLEVIPSGEPLGATVRGLDLGRPLGDEDYRVVLHALGEHGVLRFPQQNLAANELRDFAARFGELEVNVANAFQEPGYPEIMILSNIVENGKPIGFSDAGQSWHTDMSYSRTIAFANVLYALRVPRRNGLTLGSTEFSNMHAAYDDLSPDMKNQLEGLTATHDFEKFWEMMRREKGSKRPPLTDAQRKAKPPVSHPVVIKHPITGRNVLYANPGYTTKINELSPTESEELLAFLFEHQLQDKFRYVFRWQEGDVLMWENFGTIHNAVADYGPDEPRLIKRCQVMATMFADDLAVPAA